MEYQAIDDSSAGLREDSEEASLSSIFCNQNFNGERRSIRDSKSAREHGGILKTKTKAYTKGVQWRKSELTALEGNFAHVLIVFISAARNIGPPPAIRLLCVRTVFVSVSIPPPAAVISPVIGLSVSPVGERARRSVHPLPRTLPVDVIIANKIGRRRQAVDVILFIWAVQRDEICARIKRAAIEHDMLPRRGTGGKCLVAVTVEKVPIVRADSLC